MDDFKWFLPADDRVGNLPAPESEVDVSDSESEVDYIESDSAPLQITTTAVELLCPPVVTQTRPMEGCDPASPRRLRRGRDVLTEDGTVAVDTRQVSAASDTVVVSGIHMMSECFPTVMPKLPATPQAASEVDQTRPRGYCCMNLPPPVGESIESLDVDAPDAVASGKEAAPQHLYHHPEFGPLRRFFASAVTQLQRAFNDMPVPSRQPPSTDTPLLKSIRTAVDYDDRS